MRVNFVLLLAGTLVSIACSGSPTGPTDGGSRPPTISRTRFFAFGDSFTAGEVTDPVAGQSRVWSGEWGTPGILTTPHSPFPTNTSHPLILVPSASYPSVLQGRLQSTYATQAPAITVVNAGEPGERILDGGQRFPGAYDAARPEVVMLQEGANGLPLVGPDISTGVMRAMVQHAKNGGSRVFVGSMIPQVAGRPRGNMPASELTAYNATLQLMSQQEGVIYVDLYNTMLSDAPTLIGADGLHPTEAGYRRMAELFLSAIRAELETR